MIAATALIEPLARHFFGEPNARMSSKAELRFGRHGSLSVDLKKASWFDHETNAGGGVIDLVKTQKGFTETRDAMAWLEAEGFTAGRAKADHASHLPPPKPKPDRLAAAECIWRASVAIAGTPGAEYLAARGIDLDALPEHGLRFHPRCPWGAEFAPCIIARFTDPITSAPLGIRRRRIDARETPRSIGPTGGGVIRLSPDDEVSTALVIGEGVETVLAAMTRIEHRRALLRPAWACGSAGAMRDFPVLAGVEALTILVDADPPDRRGRHPGQDAARECAERWADAQREVTLLTPRDLGIDFNDLVRGAP